MKKLFLATSLVLMLFVSYAPLASAAGGTFFGPIVPNGTNGQPDCNCLSVQAPSGQMIPSAPDWGCIMQTVQNTVNFAITLGMIIAILYIVYSGFLFVMSAGNPSSREAAKTRLTNVVIGFVVVLAAWLVVDFVMKRLYGESGEWGPWNAILAEDGKPHCLQVAKPPKALPSIVGQAPPGPDTTGGTGSGNNCPPASASSMVAFPPEAVSGPSESATPTTVQNFMAMRAAALKDGVNLKVTDGYRSESEQVDLWYQYGQDTSQVAKPCSLEGGGSNHNSGVALDLTVGCAKTNSSCASKEFKWLKANGSRWGFYNDLPTDVVHWSPTGH